MRGKEPTRCASCTRFPIDKAVAGDGTAECTFWGPQHWHDRSCVLYDRVRGLGDLDTRKRWIITIMEKHPVKEAAA